MKKITFFTVVAFLFMGAISFAQGTISGTVTDGDLGGALPGANVVEDGTNNGAVTDFDGKFSFKVSSNSGTITISYLGYTTKSVSFTLSNGQADLGTVTLQPDADSLEEVVIVGQGIIDLAEDRKTPVAVSTIKAEEIQERVTGNVELAEAVKYTPSTYVSGQTGFGDAQFFLRGFDQTNIAILLNGQPVNGMEDGKVYWSNWAGIADIATAIQVQRGLGASKLAISSVGGTTNIVMKAADKKQGGYARFLGGNDSYFKGTVAYNSGVNDKGWAFSVLLDYWQAHRKWAKGTYGQGQNYYFAVGYKPNDTHNFNFLITGAPQLHGQRWSQSKEILAADPKFNQHWGYNSNNGDMNNISSERQNYYHKPVVNLNWDWTMNEKSELSTVAYLSLGRGGGTGPRGNGRIRTEDPDGDGPLYGQIDYPAIEANNALVGIGGDYGAPNGAGYIRRASVNNHIWYGMVTNFNHKLSDKFNFNIGADVRFYTGDHFRQVVDFYGLTGWSNDRPDNVVVTNSYDATPWSALFNSAPEEDRIHYDNSETINYQGVFGQLEYASDKFSAFFQGAFSNQSYEREDRFFQKKSDKVNKTGYNLKGGMAYTIDEGNGIHKMFVNAGYYSRQPYSDDIFQRSTGFITELINPEVDNQTITSFEAGYQLRLNSFRVNINAYATDWDNRTISSFGVDDNGTPDEADDIELSIFQRGVRQYHTGGEVDLRYKPSDWLTLKGFASGGSWVFKGTSDFATFNADTGDLISSEEGVNRDGIKISTAPQTTWGLGFRAKVIQGLSVDANFKYFSNHYAYTDERTTKLDYTGEQLGEYALTDAGLTYKFDLGSNKMVFRANVYNVFDRITIQQSDRYGFYNTNGRTFNASLKYKF